MRGAGTGSPVRSAGGYSGSLDTRHKPGGAADSTHAERPARVMECVRRLSWYSRTQNPGHLQCRVPTGKRPRELNRLNPVAHSGEHRLSPAESDGLDLNQRPRAYEARELPACSTVRMTTTASSGITPLTCALYYQCAEFIIGFCFRSNCRGIDILTITCAETIRFFRNPKGNPRAGRMSLHRTRCRTPSARPQPSAPTAALCPRGRMHYPDFRCRG